MGIKFRCQDCDQKLHVKSFLAGKRGICPHCGARVRIPTESQPAPQPVVTAGQTAERAGRPSAPKTTAPTRKPATKPAAPDSSSGAAKSRSAPAIKNRQSPPAAGNNGTGSQADDPLAAAPDAVWYVRPPSGGQFGPASVEIMRRWLDEGRVSPDSLIWREGWSDWKPAGPVFPFLAQVAFEPVATGEFLPDSAAAGGPTAGFSVTAADSELGVSTRLKQRSRQGGHGRNVTVIVVLSLACVALLIALFLVLNSQG